MPRRRIIDPQFWNDAQMGRLPMAIRLFYIGLWNFSDDAGLVTNDPSWLRVSIFPHDQRVYPNTVAGYLVELEHTGQPGRVLRYAEGAREYFLVTRFHDHQSIERPTMSRLPRPPQDLLDLVSERARRAVMARTMKAVKAVSLLPEGPVTAAKRVSLHHRGRFGELKTKSAELGEPDAALADAMAESARAQNEAEIDEPSPTAHRGLTEPSMSPHPQGNRREVNRRERARARIDDEPEMPAGTAAKAAGGTKAPHHVRAAAQQIVASAEARR